jgi:hypothetical protein
MQWSNIKVGSATAQAVSRRLLTAGGQVRAQFRPYGICGGQSGTRTGSSPSSSVSPVNIIPPLFYIHSNHVGAH